MSILRYNELNTHLTSFMQIQKDLLLFRLRPCQTSCTGVWTISTEKCMFPSEDMIWRGGVDSPTHL